MVQSKPSLSLDEVDEVDEEGGGFASKSSVWNRRVNVSRYWFLNDKRAIG